MISRRQAMNYLKKPGKLELLSFSNSAKIIIDPVAKTATLLNLKTGVQVSQFTSAKTQRSSILVELEKEALVLLKAYNARKYRIAIR